MARTETPYRGLSGIAETLFFTLYLRARETQRPDALIKDEKAAALVARMSGGFDRARRVPMSEVNKTTIILRNREFDRYARDFLARHPRGVVVHIGCGLDSRFDRVDDGRVEWYDLDFPNVIELHRKLLGGEGGRYHLLSCSVFDNAWPDAMSAHRRCPVLFLAEGVCMYCEEAQVKRLVLTLRDRFPDSELVFDAFSPLHVRVSNLQAPADKLGAPLRWGIWRGRKIEGWGDCIRLLGEWGFFDRPEPRLARIRWMRPIEALARTMRIYHFRLSQAEN